MRAEVCQFSNYLLIESLRRYARYFGDDLTVEHRCRLGHDVHPGRSRRRVEPSPGQSVLEDDEGRRPLHGRCEKNFTPIRRGTR